MSLFSKIAVFFVRLEIRRLERLLKRLDRDEDRSAAKWYQSNILQLQAAEARLVFGGLRR